MKIKAVTIGDLPKIMREEIRAGERAVTNSVHEAGLRAKEGFRDQIAQAGLGRLLGLSIREQTYPEDWPSMDAASLIWTKAPKILSAHIKGALIRSKSGFYLAIPTPEAGKNYLRHRITPQEWERERGIKLRFVSRPGKPSLLVADDARLTKAGRAMANRSKRRKDGILTGALTVVIFILVPQVRLKKRLDLAAIVAESGSYDRVGRDILAHWELYDRGHR